MTAEPRSRNTHLQAWIRALEQTAAVADRPTVTLPGRVDELAEIYGDAPALLGERETITYRGLAERSRRYARWALANGVGPGTVVGLLMTNQPEYVAIWLGIVRVGGVAALINTNLTGDVLSRSIALVSPKHVIVDTALEQAATGGLVQLAPSITCWVHGPSRSDTALRIDRDVEGFSAAPLDDAERATPSVSDLALHIYTSGTTGLPKAANITHFRLLEWSCWFTAMMDAQAEDRLYNCLPLYHSTGGITAIGAMLLAGGSVVLRQRFSASRFWDDVIANDCTIFQYIGELCRYLLNASAQPSETGHRIRLCCGNGLQRGVWEPFQRRFRIPQILEFYASTEGNVSLYNCEGRPGAIGRIPPFLAHRLPVALIRCDDLGNPLRNEQGLCMPCGTDEVGEALGRIGGTGEARISQFDGYTDQTASERKVLHDVFAAGDAWFRTGDLMRKDAQGFFYFVDRLGDTFRWKGENVATTEVAEVIAACPQVTEAVVYGVRIPGAEGRAGMAAITVGPAFELDELRRHLAARLAPYARPLFVRVCQALKTTGTFKPIKTVLADEGFDPAGSSDPVFVEDRDRQAYVRLTPELHGEILQGQFGF